MSQSFDLIDVDDHDNHTSQHPVVPTVNGSRTTANGSSTPGNPFIGDDLDPYEPYDHYNPSYNRVNDSFQNLGPSISRLSTNASQEYFHGTGIIPSDEVYDNDYLQNGDGAFTKYSSADSPHGGFGRSKGLSGIYSSVKSKLGFQDSHYSEMDLPLTEQGHMNASNSHHTAGDARDMTASSLPSSAGNKPGGIIDDEKEKQDFDIRRYYYKLFGRKAVDSSRLGPRIIELNNPVANRASFRDNHISTTKYNIATFIPKFLFEQFSKYANLFFLCTSAIQQVPNVSPTNRYTTIGTLAVVLSVSAVKEFIEDIKRSNADKELNNSTVDILTATGTFERRRWIKVQVGDIVRVNSEEPFPADMILLASSEPEGLCYIETANLDGETNLKIKQAKEETSHLVNPTELSHLKGKIISEQPNSSLYTFEATMELQSSSSSGKKIPLNPDQLLLRGATLRNTPWINGIVVFTGHETKLMRNATAAPIKRTAVEHMINLQIVFLFCILLVLAVISSLGNVIKTKFSSDSMSYLYLEGTNLVKLFFSDLLTYWVLFSNLVPIRYVS